MSSLKYKDGSSWKEVPTLRGSDGVSPTLSASKTGKVTTVYYTDKTHTTPAVLATINDGADGQGSGDMLKATYDPANGARQVAFADEIPNNKSVLETITAVLIAAWNAASTWITTNGANVLSHLSDTVKHITAAERAAWGAKYDKPAAGIPDSDIASAGTWNGKQDAISDLSDIRSGASLGATAVQTETDPVFLASAAHDITASDITSWNGKGTYSKPSTGIPKTDLASDVQTSLGKADTALQSHQSLADYRTSAEQDTIDAGKQSTLTAGDNIEIASNTIRTKAFPCNPNLLDNWYFGNPVNQRGQTTYSNIPNEYCIDRWKVAGAASVASDVTVTINADSVTVAGPNTTGGRGFTQTLGTDLAAGTYTLTIWITANTSTSDGYIRLFDESSVVGSKTIPAGFTGVFSGAVTISSAAHRLEIRIPDSGGYTIRAVKVEVGDVQTLAHQENGAWVLNEIPDYGEQLARCQRYCYVLNSAGSQYAPIGMGQARDTTACYANVALPTTMRTLPIASLSAGSIIIKYGDTNINCTNVSTSTVSDNAIELALTASGLQNGRSYSLIFGNYGKLILSADL